jgi:hypothetical protein
VNSVNQSPTSRRDREPNPAGIVGSILAFGVVRALARAERQREQASTPGVRASTTPRRSKEQVIASK